MVSSYADADAYYSVFPDASKDDSGELERQLAAMSRHVERVTGQVFSMDDAPVARVFVPEVDSDVLHVAMMADEPTLVEFDTSRNGTFTVDVTGYELGRDYAPATSPPYNEIYLGYATGAQYVLRGQRWRVTAAWGWPDVPEEIRQAVIQLTAILRVQSPRATQTIDQLGQSVGMSRSGREIVDALMAAYKTLGIA